MKRALATAVLASWLISHPSSAEYDEIRTCGEYLADTEIRRETYTAGAVYLWIKRDDLGLGTGSALIAMNPAMRQMLDSFCGAAPSDSSAMEVLATTVMPPIAAALAANPQD